MTVGEGVFGVLGLAGVIVFVRAVQSIREAVRNGRCVFCGEPSDTFECAECWYDRASGGK